MGVIFFIIIFAPYLIHIAINIHNIFYLNNLIKLAWDGLFRMFFSHAENRLLEDKELWILRSGIESQDTDLIQAISADWVGDHLVLLRIDSLLEPGPEMLKHHL